MNPEISQALQQALHCLESGQPDKCIQLCNQILAEDPGLIQALYLRGWSAFGTAHAWLASLALALFATTALLGRRLERGDRSRADTHALLAGLSLLAGVAAFGAGFVLLP